MAETPTRDRLMFFIGQYAAAMEMRAIAQTDDGVEGADAKIAEIRGIISEGLDALYAQLAASAPTDAEIAARDASIDIECNSMKQDNPAGGPP